MRLTLQAILFITFPTARLPRTWIKTYSTISAGGGGGVPLRGRRTESRTANPDAAHTASNYRIRGAATPTPHGAEGLRIHVAGCVSYIAMDRHIHRHIHILIPCVY